MQEIWFTSDFHFGHTNILKYENRPFAGVEDMNWELVHRFNSVVMPGDAVWILGDFAFGPEEFQRSIFEKLNGNKFIIVGNHDRSPASLDRIGFQFVAKSAEIEIAGHKVLLSHYPYRNPDDPDQRYQARRFVDEGHFLLHGHVHSRWKQLGRQINVGCDVWDYYPVSMRHIEKLIKSAEAETKLVEGESDVTRSKE